MKAKISEEFVSGFCKAQNQIRMVACECEELEDGSKRMLSSDCAYGTCEHSGSCLLMRQLKNT